MKKINASWEKDGYLLRLAGKEDAENYYEHNFNPLDSDIARFTGCKPIFTHEEVVNFFLSCVDDEERYDFLLLNSDGNIVGESVINEIDWELRKANFRIAIFHEDARGKGIGSWLVQVTRDFAFEQLRLHRLELDVFSFNKRAEKVYLKAGFQREGVLRDSVKDGEKYADDILMAILEEDWMKIKENETYKNKDSFSACKS